MIMESINATPEVVHNDPSIDLNVDSSDERVAVRSLMTSSQLDDAKGRKHQPVQVYVQNPGLGKSSGYYGLDTEVRKSASIRTDDQGRALIISAVAGGA